MPTFPENALDATEDAVLGGRLVLRQPRRGHRVGHDAILVAAATPAKAGEHAIDFGAGVGAAGLALADRVPGLAVTLVEIDSALAVLAGENINRNGFADRVRAVVLDVTGGARAFVAAALPSGSAARVLMNPPFNDPARHKPSPDPRRRAAHDLAPSSFAPWIGTAARLLRPNGKLTVIVRADGTAALLNALGDAFGAIALLPVHGKPNATAIRVIVGAIKGSRAPLAILPGLVLAGNDGTPTPAAEAVLRHAEALTLFT